MRKKFAPEVREERSYGADSKEYRNAFLKNLLGTEMTKEERAAFVHMTTNTSAVLPTTMLNQIWDLVSKQHSIMGDVTIYRTGTILEVVKHTAIAQGAAKSVAENTANDDEQNTFVKVTLSGKDFSKHVDVSYAMERMSIDALEQYLVSEISASLGDAMASDVITQIGTDMESGNKIESAAAVRRPLRRLRNCLACSSAWVLYLYMPPAPPSTTTWLAWWIRLGGPSSSPLRRPARRGRC